MPRLGDRWMIEMWNPYKNRRSKYHVEKSSTPIMLIQKCRLVRESGDMSSFRTVLASENIKNLYLWICQNSLSSQWSESLDNWIINLLAPNSNGDSYWRKHWFFWQTQTSTWRKTNEALNEINAKLWRSQHTLPKTDSELSHCKSVDRGMSSFEVLC